MVNAVAPRSLSDVVPSRTATRLRAFRREAERALPGRIERVVLFGSRARGEAHRGSDYDVAVFVRDVDDRRAVDHILTDIAYPHILAGVHIRPIAIPVTQSESRPRHPLVTSIARDGITVR